MAGNFSLAGFRGLIGELDVLISTAAHNKAHAAQFTADAVAATEKSQVAMAGCLEEIENIVLKQVNSLLTLMPCSHIEAAAESLRYFVINNNERTWDSMFQRLCRLREAITVEISDYIVYVYPKNRAITYRSYAHDWRAALTAFPYIVHDAFAATDCYALGQPTASVFHSMRAAEHGLRTLALERGLTLPKDKAVEWATWQEIVNALDAEIKEISQMKAGQSKDEQLAFYSGARADINGFKDEYRNSVMHARAAYDEAQALRALTMVRHFLDRLSKKLDHTHSRISWDL